MPWRLKAKKQLNIPNKTEYVGGDNDTGAADLSVERSNSNSFQANKLVGKPAANTKK